MNRRLFIFTSVAAAVAAIIAAKPSEQGAPHDAYFSDINSELKRNSQSKPSLLIDLDKLDHNITELKALVNDAAAYRVVVKSLPSMDLLRYVMQKADTDKLMVFHQPFLSLITQEMRMPMCYSVSQCQLVLHAIFIKTPIFQAGFFPDNQLQWLIDSEQRLQQYLALAKEIGVRMRVNIELDVGLHRGGFKDARRAGCLARFDCWQSTIS